MEKSFSSVEFLNELGRELLENFDRAGRATTPGLVGGARETAARQKLEGVLPSATAVGSGCVIDTNGATSRQQDIVLFERYLCPVFSINNSSEATYYPCEGVIAVGEVKSGLDRAGLIDSVEKIRSAKALLRKVEDPLSWRKYGSLLGIQGAPEERYDQTTKVWDQIYGFILCDHFSLKVETLLEAINECHAGVPTHLAFNLIVSLRDGCVLHGSRGPGGIQLVHALTDVLVHAKVDRGDFQYLLARLYWIITQGRTCEKIPLQTYLMGHGSKVTFITTLDRA